MPWFLAAATINLSADCISIPRPQMTTSGCVFSNISSAFSTLFIVLESIAWKLFSLKMFRPPDSEKRVRSDVEAKSGRISTKFAALPGSVAQTIIVGRCTKFS